MDDENNRNPIYPIIPSEDTFPESRGSKRVIGYFLNYETQNIRREQLEKLTHAIFAFVPLNSDGTFEFQDERSQERLKSLRNKARRTGVKVLFSTDGRWMGEEFRQVVGDPVKQRTFINSILSFLNEYQLDGIELSWKWPKTPDQFKYSELLEKLRESFNNQYILCVAVPPAGIEDWVTGFDFDEIIEHCDFINVFSTDYNGPWDNQWGTPTGPMSPLYSGVGDRKNFNVDYTMQYYIQKTREPGKLNILIPFGVRLWRNVEEGEGPVRNVELVDGKAIGVICMPRGRAKEDGWQLTNPEWDEESKSSFFYEKGVYLTFETGKSVRAKRNYVDQMKLGGVCIWSVDMDDEEDKCPGGTVTFDKPQKGVTWYPKNFTDAPLFPDDYQCKYKINVPAGWSARVILSVNASSDIFISPVRITNQFQETEIISDADQIYFYFINPGGLIELNTQKAKVRFGFVVDWLQYPSSSSSPLRQQVNQLDTVPLMESIPQSSIFTQTADTQVSLTVITYDYDFYYMYFRGLLVYDGPDINSPCLGTAFDVYKKQIQFVSSGRKMTFLSLLRDNVPNLPKLILQDYSNTKGIVQFQGVACNSATWCGVYSMNASKGPVAVQTIYSSNYYESDVLISVDGQGTLEVYNGGVTKDKQNSYAVYNAATSAPYLPQEFLGPLKTYLLTYGQAKINLTRDWHEFSITKAYGRKGFVASQMYNQMKTYQNGYTKILAPIGLSDAKFKVKIASIDMAGNTYFEIEGTRNGETTFDQIFNSTNPPDPKNPYVLSGDTLTVWYNSQNTATKGIFYRFEVNPP